MAISYVDSNDTGAFYQNSELELNLPEDIAEGDVALLWVDTWFEGSKPYATVEGFELQPLGSANVMGDGQYGTYQGYLFWRRLDGTETSLTIDAGFTMYLSGQLQVFRGVVASGNPFEDKSEQAGTGTNQFGSYPAVTVDTVAGGALAQHVYNDDPASGHTPSSGFTGTSDVDCAASAYKLVSTGTSHTTSGGSVDTTTSNAIHWLASLIPA